MMPIFQTGADGADEVLFLKVFLVNFPRGLYANSHSSAPSAP